MLVIFNALATSSREKLGTLVAIYKTARTLATFSLVCNIETEEPELITKQPIVRKIKLQFNLWKCNSL